MSIDKEMEEFKTFQNDVIELKSWQNRFRKSGTGESLKIIATSIFNVELILENDMILKNKLSFNEFSQEIEMSEQITLKNITIPKGYFDDSFIHALKSYIEQTYNFIPQTGNVESAVSNVSKRNSYHPLKKYLQKCKHNWDGKNRIFEILPKYLGIKSSEYTSKAFLCLMIGGIQKIYAPQEKFDFIFDFVGDTGTGKTSFIQKLFLDNKNYYTDSMKTFTQADDFMIMQRAWCVNDDELVVSKKTGIEVIKKFSSQKELEYRVPYARKSIRRFKNFVFVRTTNEHGHLKDETGNRRFIPLEVKKAKQKVHPLSVGDEQMDTHLISQLWGEAMQAYSDIDRKAFYVEVENLAKAELDGFTSVDSIKDIVYTILEIPVPIDFYNYNDDQRASYIQGYIKNNEERWTIGTKKISVDDLVERDRIRIKDLSLEGFDERYGKNPKRDKRIRLIMDNHVGWERKYNPSLKFGELKDRGYLRK